MKKMAAQNPRDQAGCLSVLFFSWLYGLIKLAYQRPLSEDDLYELSEGEKAEAIVEHLGKLWREEEDKNAEVKGKKPQLWTAMCRLFSFREYLFLLIRQLLECSISWSSIVFLWIFQKQSLEDPQKSMSNLHVAVMIWICFFCLAEVFFINHNLYKVLKMGMQMKIACMGIVYKKVLASNRSTMSKNTAGYILNLVSNDAKRMEKLFVNARFTMRFLLDLPVTIVILTFLVGWQSLSGLVFILVISFVETSLISRHFGKLRIKQASITDKRLSILHDIIRGIRTVKMYTLEWKYRGRVSELRREEIKFIRLKNFILNIPSVWLSSLSAVATLISVFTMVYSGIHVNAINIFTLALTMGTINESMSLQLRSTSGLSDTLASIFRIEKYLLDKCSMKGNELSSNIIRTSKASFKDLLNYFIKHEQKLVEKIAEYPVKLGYTKNTERSLKRPAGQVECTNEPKVILSQVCSGWFIDSSQSVLKDLSLSVRPTQLVMVTGPVGSGKSTLLMTILKQISIKSGTVSTEGQITYASQMPWIFTGTVRDNILFGKVYQQKRYQRVLEVCDLSKDIRRFPKGDLSMIGQRGVSLSGGQRARVGLARAVYSDADIFLLDDPLSAVDAKVGKHIFEKCICEELSGKIRILVTHQLQYLHRADEIVVLKEGRIVDQGTYEHISTGTSISKILEDYETDDSKGAVPDANLLPSQDDFVEEAGRDMIEEDEDKGVRSGTVSWQLFWDYLRMGLPAPLLLCLFVFFLIVQGAIVVSYWWQKVIAAVPYIKQRSPTILGVYASIVCGSLLLASSRIFLLVLAFLRSSEEIHDRMTFAVLKSPVFFFDTNPVGGIMNRFSKDMGTLDDFLPSDFTISACTFAQFVGVVCLTSIMNIWLFIALTPILIFIIILSILYLKIVRQLSRFEANRCSPIYEHIGETISGLEVIHSSKMDASCMKKYYRLQNRHTQAFSSLLSTRQAIGLYVMLLFSLFTTVVGIGCLLQSLDAGTTGLLLSYTMALKDKFSVFLRFTSLVEAELVSVERNKAYTELPSEPGYARQAEIPTNWPNQGALSIRGVSLAYFEGGSSILKDIDLDVHPRQKVGIAGRTGAGKSSLVAALFRMPDPQGQVFIDGIDLGSINVQDARSSMAVITQSPVLFEGSLKMNLDPFDQFTDDEIWIALKEVQLLNCVSKLDGLLSYSFGEEGSGLSVGERQLLCLARALLQRRKILVLDEATANVDYRTDQLIQQVIRDRFSDCTVLTIAHRLNTIIDYDRVVVLDGGRIVEDDSPRVLASKSDRIFARLLNDQESPY